MEIIELFKNSLRYPTTDWKKIIILGVISLIMSILVGIFVFAGLLSRDISALVILTLIGTILGLIVFFIINGYILSIVRNTINGIEELPEFKLKENIIDGLKVIVMNFIYFLIPTIITLVVAYISGVYSKMLAVISYSAMYSAFGSATIPTQLITDLQVSMLLTGIIAIILFVIFTLIAYIAEARLAETSSLGSAFQVKEVINTIGQIGWGNYIIWFILIIIISMVIGTIGSLINLIPIVGSIIYILIVTPYMLIFIGRALGLIYNESKN